MPDEKTSKPVTFRMDKWLILNRWAKELSEDLGITVSLPDAALYAIGKLKEMRETPAVRREPKG